MAELADADHKQYVDNFGGNASFTGTIHAPEADFKLKGGGSSIYDFIGAAVLRTVNMNGHFNFH